MKEEFLVSQNEVADRLTIIINNFNQYVACHDFVSNRPKLKKKIESASAKLVECLKETWNSKKK